MDKQPAELGRPNDEMHRREITLEDGRYMIFYTFGDEELQGEKQNEQRQDV